ncbi:MAG TPA: type II toxin-antitoxin system YafQ family toxin [Gemmatimonadales bacterium]|nr:type II toxin-antitoxin system YafQ family toxin [Gemmatimonadales bacterium]
MSFSAHKQFRKDFQKHARSNRKDVLAVVQTMFAIVAGEPLPPNARPHPLAPPYDGCMECHIGGDLLLIWKDDGQEVTFVRLGTHSELFDE